MEKRIARGVLRGCAVLIVFGFSANWVSANLLNTGFELAATTNYVFQDSVGNILTNREPLIWTVNNLGFRTQTNGPASGQYQDPDFFYVYSGINSSASPVTAHAGAYSARIFGPFDVVCCGKASLYQVLTNTI